MTKKVRAVVKRWDTAKGYGFVRVSGEAEDRFVHFRSILGSGRRDLVVGRMVEGRPIRTEKGGELVDVVQLGEAEALAIGVSREIRAGFDRLHREMRLQNRVPVARLAVRRKAER